MENVEGLGFRGKDEGLRLFAESLAEINTELGTRYRASVAVLNAADFGVPQLRRRLFIIGSRDGREFRFPTPTHADRAEGDELINLPPYRTTWDALHDVTEPNETSSALKGKWADLLASIPEGQNYLWHTERGGGEPLFGWRRRYWSFLLKLAKNQPAWTLQAQPGPATGPFHWRNRRLTAREMARLQTFPEDVEITGSLADAQRQLGNAVPSLLAEVLARAIARQLLDFNVRRKLPRLSVAAALTPPPPAEPVVAVPAHHLRLRGEHAAHPGTGKGNRALARDSASRLAV